nr:NirD/YgiW/YdeI family stress tolerance protein [uncultured Moellerella sp.]
MKKLSTLALITALASAPAIAVNGGFEGPGATTAAAQTSQTGGFTDANASQTSVGEALKLKDDSWVVMSGKIVKQLDKKHYEFTDGTGTITLEIDRKQWKGVNVTPNDKIQIRGKIDKDWRSTEVDVSEVQIIK